MNTSDFIIGIDIGTTGIRAAAYTLAGVNLAQEEAFYPLETPRAHHVEQDALVIYESMLCILRTLIRSLKHKGAHPIAIALSAPMHSLSLADTQGKLLSRMLTWADSRAYPYVKEFLQDTKKSRLWYEKTCCPPHSCYPYYKLLWFKQQGIVFSRIYSIKDFVFEKLTGQWCIDKACASATSLYNAFTLTWDTEILDSINITASHLPRVVDTDYSAPLLPAIAQELGLEAFIPIIIGASDGVLVNLGIGACEKGEMSLTIGTSGAVRLMRHGAICDAHARTWCYNLHKDTWVIGGAMNNGGVILRWLRDTLYSAQELASMGECAYEMMIEQAALIPPGSHGLLALPFLAGERAPYWDSELRGMFFGLSLHHSRAHLIRATMEGINYGIRAIFHILCEYQAPTSVRVSGSFTKSPIWLQMLSNILSHKLTLPKNAEGAAFGAALLGFLSLGYIKHLNDIPKLSAQDIYYPQQEHEKIYHTLFAMYERLAKTLRQECANITALQTAIE